MTTPTGTISMSDVAIEIYGSNQQIDMKDPNVYLLAQLTNGSQISMSDLKGMTWQVFSPAAGTLSNLDAKNDGTAEITLTSTNIAVWNYTKTAGIASSVSVGNGGSNKTITFTLGTVSSNSSYSVTATAAGQTASWTLHLATGDGTGIFTG